jgi:hypothetical protein
MISGYFYEGQLRSYLLQFCNIFTNMKVMTGKNECGETEFMSVPITVGSRDRVVAALQTGNTQNKTFSLPLMAASITGIQMSQNRKGVGVVDRKVYLPEGGAYPDDLRTVVRVMPVPYILSVELAIYASNTHQMHQILEQIMMIFDPILQIQTSDSAFDWTKITTVELQAINNQENYPPAANKRVIQWDLSFEMPIFISAPVDIKDELVRKIIITYGDLEGYQIDEFDDEGNLIPFITGSEFGTTTVTRT